MDEHQTATTATTMDLNAIKSRALFPKGKRMSLSISRILYMGLMFLCKCM